MKIKNTVLSIVKGDIMAIDCDAIIHPTVNQLLTKQEFADATKLQKKDQDVDESDIRQIFARAFKQANGLNIKILAIPAIGHGAKNVAATGCAKIMAQEILKYLNFNKTSLQEIIICLDGDKTYQSFDQTINGYITHIQDTLGLGPYLTVDIIIELSEGIILIERSNPPYGWALPGGFVDYGESLEESAIREAKEETNMDLEDLRQFHTYSEADRDPRFHTVSTVFIAKGVGTPQFGDDAKGLKIVRYEDLTSLEYAFDHNQVIADYLAARK